MGYEFCYEMLETVAICFPGMHPHNPTPKFLQISDRGFGVQTPLPTIAEWLSTTTVNVRHSLGPVLTIA